MLNECQVGDDRGGCNSRRLRRSALPGRAISTVRILHRDHDCLSPRLEGSNELVAGMIVRDAEETSSPPTGLDQGLAGRQTWVVSSSPWKIECIATLEIIIRLDLQNICLRNLKPIVSSPLQCGIVIARTGRSAFSE
jgi:hypothetical protein